MTSASSAPVVSPVGGRLESLRLARTRMALLVAACAGLTATAAAMYPRLATVVFALLLGLVFTVGICLPLPRTLLIGLPAAITFALIGFGLTVLERDPGAIVAGLSATTESHALREPGVWGPVVAGAAFLGAVSVGATWASAGLAMTSRVRATPPPELVPRGEVGGGRERAERELAWAAQEGRLLTLGLIGIDAPADGGEEAGARDSIMEQLDETVEMVMAEAGALCDYGTWERLVILPDVWAEDFREAAVHLTRVARQRVRLPVRAALISFPRDGSRAANPLDYLERALEVCRAGRTSVSVGRPRMRHLTPPGGAADIPGGGDDQQNGSDQVPGLTPCPGDSGREGAA